MGKLVKVEPEVLTNVKRSKANNLKVLEEFMGMDTPCVEYIGYTQKTGHICQQSLQLSARKFGFHNVQVRYGDGHVYLIRKDLIGKVKF